MPDLELLEENARPAALAERAGSGAAHHARADDDRVHPLHGSDRTDVGSPGWGQVLYTHISTPAPRASYVLMQDLTPSLGGCRCDRGTSSR